MNASHTPVKPDSRLPWRVAKAPYSCYEIWTRYDDTAGSRNNYVIADGIQHEDEAILLASAPTLLAQRDELMKQLQGVKAVLEHCNRLTGCQGNAEDCAFAMGEIRSIVRVAIPRIEAALNNSKD